MIMAIIRPRWKGAWSCSVVNIIFWKFVTILLLTKIWQRHHFIHDDHDNPGENITLWWLQQAWLWWSTIPDGKGTVSPIATTFKERLVPEDIIMVIIMRDAHCAYMVITWWSLTTDQGGCKGHCDHSYCDNIDSEADNLYHKWGGSHFSSKSSAPKRGTSSLNQVALTKKK